MKESLSDVGAFVAEYAAHMMGCGVHTSRVIRCAKRIGEAYGYEVRVSVFQKSIILNVQGGDPQERYNEVTEIPPLPISFAHNAELSALSWETHDDHLPLAEVKERYRRIVQAPAMPPLLVLVLAGLANASFCALFGGDWCSRGIVFVATVAGFFLKQRMTAAHVNHYIVFALSAFVASLCASVSLFFDTTAEIALSTSVLFLVPGVPLINGVIDILEGHMLNGFARLANAALLIVCIAVGLSFTLMLVKDSLL